MSTSHPKIARGIDYYDHPARSAPSDRIALLLAGGDGMRLRELTREIAGAPIPKQYCRLLNGASMLEAAISRVQLVFPSGSINIIIGIFRPRFLHGYLNT